MSRRALQFFQGGGRLREQVGLVLHPAAWALRHVRGQYPVPEFDQLRVLVAVGSVALDVGAHAGSWTRPLSRVVGVQGLVICYEALPYYGRSLRRCLRLLRIRNVLVRTVAVGESPGKVPFRWRSDEKEPLSGHSHIETTSIAGPATVTVEMTNLDHDLSIHGIDPEDISFVKIDVEGAELFVLRGARGMLSVAHPAIYLEAESRWTERFGYEIDDIFSELGALGYEAHIVRDGRIEEISCPTFRRSGHNNLLFLSSRHASRTSARDGLEGGAT